MTNELDKKLAPKFILSLGSGGLRGFIHLGVYKALSESKIKIQALYGCSVGGLVGAFISAGWPAEGLIDLALKLSPFELLDFTFSRDGYLQGKKLNEFIKKNISIKYIEDLPIPLTLVATKTSSGEAEYFQQGVLSDCVQASSAIPGVFKPVIINNTEYLDGDLCSPVLIKKPRQDHPQAVILAINLIPQAADAPRSGKKWSKLISQTIYRQTIVAHERQNASIYLNPILGYGVQYSRSAAQKRIEIGYEQTRAIIPELKKLLDLPV